MLRNDELSPLFMAAIEATEEAIINSIITASTITGKNKRKVESLPIGELLEIMNKYNRLRKN